MHLVFIQFLIIYSVVLSHALSEVIDPSAITLLSGTISVLLYFTVGFHIANNL